MAAPAGNAARASRAPPPEIRPSGSKAAASAAPAKATVPPPKPAEAGKNAEAAPAARPAPVASLVGAVKERPLGGGKPPAPPKPPTAPGGGLGGGRSGFPSAAALGRRAAGRGAQADTADPAARPEPVPVQRDITGVPVGVGDGTKDTWIWKRGAHAAPAPGAVTADPTLDRAAIARDAEAMFATMSDEAKVEALAELREQLDPATLAFFASRRARATTEANASAPPPSSAAATGDTAPAQAAHEDDEEDDSADAALRQALAAQLDAECMPALEPTLPSDMPPLQPAAAAGARADASSKATATAATPSRNIADQLEALVPGYRQFFDPASIKPAQLAWMLDDATKPKSPATPGATLGAVEGAT